MNTNKIKKTSKHILRKTIKISNFMIAGAAGCCALAIAADNKESEDHSVKDVVFYGAISGITLASGLALEATEKED